jgi:hypothetical protein
LFFKTAGYEYENNLHSLYLIGVWCAFCIEIMRCRSKLAHNLEDVTNLLCAAEFSRVRLVPSCGVLRDRPPASAPLSAPNAAHFSSLHSYRYLKKLSNGQLSVIALQKKFRMGVHLKVGANSLHTNDQSKQIIRYTYIITVPTKYALLAGTGI